MSQDAKEMLKKQLERLNAVKAAAKASVGSAQQPGAGQAIEATFPGQGQTLTPAQGTPGQIPTSTT